MTWFKTQAIDSKRRWQAAAAFGGALLVNAAAGSTTLLGGLKTAEVSDTHPTLFTPAGSTFAIWGVIYLSLVGFCLYCFGVGRSKTSTLKPKTINAVLGWFSISSLLNMVWILLWQYQAFWLSVVVIAAMLYSLARLNDVLRNVRPSGRDYWLVRAPFSIYFGWVSVAAIANIAVWLADTGWDGFGVRPGIWTVLTLLVSAVVGLIIAIRNSDATYLTVFVWAYAGILLKHLSTSGYNGAYPTIIITLTVLLAVCISTVLGLALPSLQRWLHSER